MTEDLNSLPPEVTKQAYRKKVWDYLEKNNLASFPRPVHGRIPNFKGSAEAAEKLSQLDVFKSASCVKVNPDKPQEAVRFLALEANKSVLMPIPRLRSGLFYHVEPPPSGNKRDIRAAAARYGAERFGKACDLDTKVKVDLVVLGSVAVSKEGYRIGKGEGFGDLEFAIMMKIGVVEEDTFVVSTVHDCQVFDTLPHELFKEHDVPVDIIVTPTQVIEVSTRLPKPKGILWNILSNRRLQLMPILQILRENEISEGKDCTLKEVDSDVEELPQRRRPFVGFPRNRFPRRFNEDRSRFNDDRPRFVDRRPRFNDGRGRFNDGRGRFNDGRRRFSDRRPRYVEDRERRPRSERRPQPERRPRPERRRPDRSTSGENNTDERRQRNGMPSRTFRRRRRSFYDSNSRQSSSEKTHNENSDSNENAASTNNDGNAVNKTNENTTGHESTKKNTQSRGTSPIKLAPFRRYRQQRRMPVRKPAIEFSVRVDNIASTVRVRDLKNALAERNVRPSDITWRGPKGFALLHFAKLGDPATQNEPIAVDSIVSSLQNLNITTEEGKSLKVEPAKPVTRIEVTDISSV